MPPLGWGLYLSEVGPRSISRESACERAPLQVFLPSCPESRRPVGMLRPGTCPRWPSSLSRTIHLQGECNRDQFGGQLRGSGGAIPDFKITRTEAGGMA